jgi:hypoxanthine phosphoribosyltransferase
MSSISKRYISWTELEGHVLEIARQIAIDEWVPDIIVGITRGGALPAVMLSHYFECEMVGLSIALRDKDGEQESNTWLPEDALEGRRILIVDDINDTGATINWLMADWETSVAAKLKADSFPWGKNVRFAVLIDNEASNAAETPHYSGENINKAADPCWIIFPYEDFWQRK